MRGEILMAGNKETTLEKAIDRILEENDRWLFPLPLKNIKNGEDSFWYVRHQINVEESEKAWCFRSGGNFRGEKNIYWETKSQNIDECVTEIFDKCVGAVNERRAVKNHSKCFSRALGISLFKYSRETKGLTIVKTDINTLQMLFTVKWKREEVSEEEITVYALQVPFKKICCKRYLMDVIIDSLCKKYKINCSRQNIVDIEFTFVGFIVAMYNINKENYKEFAEKKGLSAVKSRASFVTDKEVIISIPDVYVDKMKLEYYEISEIDIIELYRFLLILKLAKLEDVYVQIKNAYMTHEFDSFLSSSLLKDEKKEWYVEVINEYFESYMEAEEKYYRDWKVVQEGSNPIESKLELYEEVFAKNYKHTIYQIGEYHKKGFFSNTDLFEAMMGILEENAEQARIKVEKEEIERQEIEHQKEIEAELERVKMEQERKGRKKKRIEAIFNSQYAPIKRGGDK